MQLAMPEMNAASPHETVPRPRFEALLADLSARFINLPAEQTDAAIKPALRQMCRCMEMDVCSLWQRPLEHPQGMVLTHCHAPADFPQMPADMEAAETFPWCLTKLLNCETVELPGLAYVHASATRDLEILQHYGLKSFLAFPLSAGGGAIFGLLCFGVLCEERDWLVETVKRCHLFAQILANALARKFANEASNASELRLKHDLSEALNEVRRMRRAVKPQTVQPRDHSGDYADGDAIVGESQMVQTMLALGRRVAPTDSAVLITGETGTGKELMADAIHQQSPRGKRNMVKVNCAALPPSLIESELFGRERGAYTGAMTQQPGRFEAADGSTIFLDEIAELPLELQSKLLRVLQEGQFERLGSNRTRKVDVRVIAATNRDLEAMVKDQRFRADLYYRLNVFPIRVPPLRDRREDIPLLVWKFVRHFATKMGKPIDSIPREAMESLTKHAWPGNIRELRNLIERAVILSDAKVLQLHFPVTGSQSAVPTTLADAERLHVLTVLAQTHWRISGPNGAAAILGLIPTTLHSKLKKLGINRSPDAPGAPPPPTSF